MIKVTVKPRRDNKFDVHIADDNGNELLSSNQGYENVEDAEKVVRRIFSLVAATDKEQSVVLRVEYRNGKTKTEQLR
jgi:hypothetical protein